MQILEGATEALDEARPQSTNLKGKERRQTRVGGSTSRQRPNPAPVVRGRWSQCTRRTDRNAAKKRPRKLTETETGRARS
eukprot:10465343-Heterocapsa_arctica.AAC.1